MENRWIIFIAVATFSWSEAASKQTFAENSIPWRVEKSMIDSIYSRGRQQIMNASISPICRQMALTALSDAALADSSMNCTNAMEIAEDVGDVLLSIWNSTGKLMDDINTVVNGIPLCMDQYPIWNIFGKIGCLIDYIKPIWNAVKDIWNFEDFWMVPYKEIEAFIHCIRGRKSNTTGYVNMIVKNARSCN